MSAAAPNLDVYVRLLGAAPEARLAAAWQIGVARGAGARRLVEGRLRAEPHPGVRRHLLVMLAGFGAVDAVVRAAREDPDVRVRATAFVQLARIAEPGQVGLHDLLGSGLSDARDQIRSAVLENLRDDAPAWLKAEAERRRPAPPTRPKARPAAPALTYPLLVRP